MVNKIHIQSKHIISAYLLGILSMLLILLPMWYLSKKNNSIGNIVDEVWCRNIQTT